MGFGGGGGACVLKCGQALFFIPIFIRFSWTASDLILSESCVHFATCMASSCVNDHFSGLNTFPDVTALYRVLTVGLGKNISTTTHEIFMGVDNFSIPMLEKTKSQNDEQ